MKKIAWIAPLACAALCTLDAVAQTSVPQGFTEAVQQVISRPVFRHAVFGIEVYSLDTQKTLFALNGDKLFTPGSTTKLLTEGTALHLLGPDYRFHTFIYRTGEVNSKGKLKGDLVLVASGDPNLSNRMQPDGTLAFADEDHSYGGPRSRLVPGDPLVAMHEFAKQIVAAGIKELLQQPVPSGRAHLGPARRGSKSHAQGQSKPACQHDALHPGRNRGQGYGEDRPKGLCAGTRVSDQGWS
jgi:D-alanyl-D-alanine carboxypeptidase/D-alanyl-D-alanine-endopeptidase (penicillin-binding protein 4)